MKLLKLADKVISVLGLLLFGILTGISLFTTVYYTTEYKEIPYQKNDSLVIVFLTGALITLVMYWISQWILKQRHPEKWIRFLLGAVLTYAFVFCVLWVRGSGCIPAGDQASVCKAAEGFLAGDYSMLTRESYEKYLYIHPHQLGLAALLEVVFAWFGSGSFLAFEYLNCCGVVLCLYGGFGITRLLTEEKRAWIYYLFLAAFCFPLFFYTPFVYGEIPSIAYSMAAAWMFLGFCKKENGWYLAGCCFFATLAYLIRNNSVILMIAFLCILLVKGLGKKQWKPFAACAGLILCMLVSRWGLRTVYEERAGIIMNEGAPMLLYIAMGMQEGGGAPGWSNGYILHNYWGESEFDEEASAAMARHDIAASLEIFQESPSYAVDFYTQKFTSQWNDPSYQCFAMTHINGWERGPIVNSMFDGKLQVLMTWFMNQYQSLIFAGVFLWLIYQFWREKGLENQVLLIFVFGGFLFHMLWEAKGRYILPYFVAMLPMAAAGLAECSARIKSLLLKGKKHGNKKEETYEV